MWGEFAKRVIRIVRRSFVYFLKHDCLTRSAAISFFSLFSLVPILFIVTSVAGVVLGADEALLDRVLHVVREGFPYLSDAIVASVRGLIEGSFKFGWIGVVVLVLSAERVLHAIEDSLYALFREARDVKRPYLLRRLAGMCVLLVGLVITIVSIAMTIVAKAAASIKAYGTFDQAQTFLYWFITSSSFKYLLPLLLTACGAAAIYKIVGGRGVALGSAALGGIVFALLWEAAKLLYAAYVSNLVYYNTIYGSLGALMLFLLWIYYSAVVFLFGASLAATHHLDAASLDDQE